MASAQIQGYMAEADSTQQQIEQDLQTGNKLDAFNKLLVMKDDLVKTSDHIFSLA